MTERNAIEKREDAWLALYAMKSASTAGRLIEEEEHPYRTAYQRDKDRIIYSTAFRRLQYKTQVFVNHEGDYYRTRLTHTLEVAQIGRTIARSLMLNEDLVEAISLAHDLGHTPFGHAGEDTLSELMKDHGGFDHNTHGLRVVDLLERKYPDFPGLNLTQEVRRGIIRHSSPFDMKRMGETVIPGPELLEIQVVNIADEIAYDNHDLDDGLKSGMLDEEDLSGVALWRSAIEHIRAQCPHIDQDMRRTQAVRYLINLQVSDVVRNTLAQIEKLKIKNVTDIGNAGRNIVCFSEDMNGKRRCFKSALYEKLYRHYRVMRMSGRAARFLRALFGIYVENPEQLPPQALERGPAEEDVYRVICDYMAGMTDRYALDQYKKLFEPYETV